MFELDWIFRIVVLVKFNVKPEVKCCVLDERISGTSPDLQACTSVKEADLLDKINLFVL